MKKILVITIIVLLSLPVFSLEISNVYGKDGSKESKIYIYYTVSGNTEANTEYDLEFYAGIQGKVFGPLKNLEIGSDSLNKGEQKVKWDPKGEIPAIQKEPITFKVVLIKKIASKSTEDLKYTLIYNNYVIEHDGIRLVVEKIMKAASNRIEASVRVENTTNQPKSYNQGAFAYQLRFGSNHQLDAARIIINPKERQQPHIFTVPAGNYMSGIIKFYDRNNQMASLKTGDLLRLQAAFNSHEGAIDNIPLE